MTLHKTPLFICIYGYNYYTYGKNLREDGVIFYGKVVRKTMEYLARYFKGA